LRTGKADWLSKSEPETRSKAKDRLSGIVSQGLSFNKIVALDSAVPRWGPLEGFRPLWDRWAAWRP
jgi:hypothetical protein